MAKHKTDIRRKLVETCLKLAESRAWDQLSIKQIAKAAKIQLRDANSSFSAMEDFLPAIVEFITAETQSAIGKPLSKGTPHDRLFEVMMARFDVLQHHREAICNIIAAVKNNPRLMPFLLKAQADAMHATLKLAGINQSTGRNCAATLGLMAVHAATLHAWERDNSKDMSKTMAKLDQYLRYAEKAAEILFRIA